VTVVKPAEPADAEAIAALAEEMDRFYGGTDFDPLDVRVRQINEAIFSDLPSAYVLLAWNDDRLVGFASYSYLWPAVGLTRSLFLKELYVAESARRQGIGKQLMLSLYEIAAKHECSRIEWMTDKFNSNAQRFYGETLGVQPDVSKVFYRIEGGTMLT
jgi:GNAT superfamily N-acetyltransferase